MAGPKACRICGAKATGLHYGVSTCEGCKVFFKRYLGKHQYKCYFGGSCVMDVQTRHRCKACRFQKCLNEGMSLEAIRLGRTPKMMTLFANEDDSWKSPPGTSDISSPECTLQSQQLIASKACNSFLPGAQSDGSQPGSCNFSYVASCSDVAIFPTSPAPRAPTFPQEVQAEQSLVVHESWSTFLHDLSSSTNDLEYFVPPSETLNEGPSTLQLASRRRCTVHRYWGLLKAKKMLLEDSLNAVHQVGVDVFLEHYIKYENFIREVYEMQQVPYQPQTTLQQMLGYVQDMVSYFGEKLARFALGLSGFAEMNPTDQSYLIKDRWLVSFMIMNSKCYRDKEIYHPIGPHDLHYCRYWMDMAASQVSTKFLDFLFHVASQINSLQLTLTQRFVLLAVGLLKTDESDLVANRAYIDFLSAHYMETLLRSLESALAERPTVAARLRQVSSIAQYIDKVVGQFSVINEVNRKIIMTADLNHAPLRATSMDPEEVERLLSVPTSCS